MEYKDKSIKLCKHCLWGGAIGKYNRFEGINGTYCSDCSTVEKRREQDKLQIKEHGIKSCDCV